MRYWPAISTRRTVASGIVVAVFVLLVATAGAAVFLGFVGYYSRINLSAALQKEKEPENIDVVFMTIDQMSKDQIALDHLRNELEALKIPSLSG
jgi:hypothetical protein